LLLDAWEAEAWVHALLESIQHGGDARIVLVVLNAVGPLERRTLRAKLRGNWGRLTSTATRKLLMLAEETLVDRVPGRPDAFASTDLRPMLSGVPVIEVSPVQTRFSDRLTDVDVARIREHDIDVFLRLGFRILRGDILRAARYGIWSYHHGDNAVNRGGPAGFWETMLSWPETGSILQILTEDLDNGRVLYRSYACTEDVSVAYNRNGYFWKSVAFVPRKLRELRDLGGERFLAKVEEENRHPVFYPHRLFSRPGNAEHTRLLARKLAQKVRRRIRSRLYFDQWCVLFDLSPELSGSLWRFKRLVPPADRFWADPHILWRDGQYFVFIEQYVLSEGRGHIAVIVMDETGRSTAPVRVLERPYHLSYPFVFEWNGETYMIPETSENRTIELYRCTRFPDQWELQMSLMDNIDAFDTTVLHEGGKWWLFASMVEYPGASSSDELFLFHSDTLFSRGWIPHLRNPIVSDVKRARPAGRILRHKGALYRPSQDCSGHYGRGLNLSEITVLNEREYRESLVASVKPTWDRRIMSIHHFSRERNLTVVDAQIRRFRFARGAGRKAGSGA
jgi:hypothetical protein